jgi:prepilin-type N-terminal cleavage/methylation domain-containing protein
MPALQSRFVAGRLPSRGFTRIELLVVLAVIGLTIRLVVPGIQYAREVARRDQAKDNLRKLGFAMRESGGRRTEQMPIEIEMTPETSSGTSDTKLFFEAVIALFAGIAVVVAAFVTRYAVRHFNRQHEPGMDWETRPTRSTPKHAANSIWIE